jgi:[ribosomal protein S5]-alanine N-acetyltransferase
MVHAAGYHARMIETDRLRLRPFLDEDLDALAAIYADPEVMRFVGSGGGSGLSRARTHARLWLMRIRFVQQGYGHLALIEKSSGALIGRCGLSLWDVESVCELEIGYLLARAAWGRGLATEAATAVRDYARARGMTRLICLIDARNSASVRVAERIGMRYERDVQFMGRRARLYRGL